MKKFLIPILFISAFFALYEQSKDHPNVYITIVAVVIFMFSMMRLSAKVPSKNQDNDENHDV